MNKTEAIKILKDFHDESALFSVRTALETLHPELKESEDERIREGLLKAISVILGNNKLFGTDVTKEEALAWLEKQKQHTPMQNGVIINGVVYELIEDETEDECERCALHELCNSMDDCLCNSLYSSQVSVHHRFKKR